MSRTIPDLPISAYLDEDNSTTYFWRRARVPRKTDPSWCMNPVEAAFMRESEERGNKLSEIQREVGDWAWSNFKDKALGLNPYLGMIEESGELAKAILKKAQGIRGTPEKHDSDSVDAIGDIMIYLMNHLNSSMIDIADPFHRSFIRGLALRQHLPEIVAVCRKELVVSIARTISGLYVFPGDCKESGSNDLITLLIYLDSLSRSFGTDLLTVTINTWDMVKKRNWVEDPVSGGNHTH
jgi:NTP pyrophosphatase (non-canonical NTP hydrolase)